ncbi:hypothetical protein [Streptomyces sp. NPDC002520]
MSESRAESAEPVVDGPTVVEPIYDFYLLALVKLLENLGEDSSLSMSFNVSGGLVYGQLVSRDVWEKLWLREVGQANEWVGDVLSQVASMKGEDGDEDRPVRFVHLKQATFVSGSTRQRLGLWRAPLAQIAGWSNSVPQE